MEDLSKKKCIPCEGGIPAFKLEEIHKYLKKSMDGMFLKMNIKTTLLKKDLNLAIMSKVKNLS